MVAALKYGRHSVGVEIDFDYCRMAACYLKAESQCLSDEPRLQFEKLTQRGGQLCVREEQELYRASPSKKKLEEVGQPTCTQDKTGGQGSW